MASTEEQRGRILSFETQVCASARISSSEISADQTEATQTMYTCVEMQ